MIDLDARKSLSQDVRRLITGRMTNDDFDDVYYDIYEPSRDRAVQEIASSCYCLYSSALLLPIRLRGRYAVDADTRLMVARSVLFLRSGLEYEWPPKPDSPVLRVFAGLAMFFGIPAGIAISLCGLIIGPLAILGLALLVGSALLAFWRPAFLSNDWDSFRESGDYDVWPFLQRDDFNSARQSCHLFAK